jgi:mannose-6-phosphate isomerase
MIEPYPLMFRPVLLAKTWGGHRLSRFGKELPDGERLGESWELADLDVTSSDGAGGGAVRSEIADGPLAGRTLRQAVETLGPGLLGSLRPTATGAFPLLVKFLDADEELSVQVHPTPEYASAHPDAALKNETWYVIDAAPGAVLYKGLRDGVTLAAFESEIRAGRVVECLEPVPARVGDCHHLPSGTVHALGAGIAVVEVQTPSDTTFRLWDWPDRYARPGRRLHVDRALRSCLVGPAPPTARLDGASRRGLLADAGDYDLWECHLEPGETCVPPSSGNACAIVIVLEGEVARFPGGNEAREGELGPGRTLLVPPGCAEDVRAKTAARVLVVGFPDAV